LTDADGADILIQVEEAASRGAKVKARRRNK